MVRFNLIKIAGYIGLSIVIIFLVVLIFLNQIKAEIFTLIGAYSYTAIFFITLIVESLAQPIGPEIPLLAGKVIGLNMFSVALTTLTGSVIASFISYKIGDLYYADVCADKHCSRYLNIYNKYGRFGLLISALGPVPYVPFCWFSGAFGMPIRKFLFFGVIPRIIRVWFVAYVLFIFF